MRWRLVVMVVLVLVAGCAASEPTAADILLFNGQGTSPNDVATLEGLMRERGWRYSALDSARLEAMTESELRTYRLIVFPGGNFADIGNGLTTSATTKLRGAIRSGSSYLGICAGAFFAGASPYNGLNLTDGVRFPFYTLEDRGIRKAPVVITTAAGATLEVYWEDGPMLVGWGQPVARYPEGTPAVVQGKFGEGGSSSQVFTQKLQRAGVANCRSRHQPSRVGRMPPRSSTRR